MTLPFSINGAQTVIPGVYDQFRVDDSLLSPAVAGRSVLVLGEAIEGVPGNLLDLQLNFYTNYSDVLDFYKSGPIVDAARQLFSTQPGSVFGGAVDRLYVYKTNDSTTASKALASSYGSLVAARYGEAGNLIKSQVVDAQAQVLPSLTFHYLPTPSGAVFDFSVNGALSTAMTLMALDLTAGHGTPTDFATQAATVTGLNASGGTARTMLATGTTVGATFSSPSAGTLAITLSSGTWGSTTIVAGDLCVIPAGHALSGAANANSGCYLVQSCTTTVLTIVRLNALGTSTQANDLAFDLTAAVGITASAMLASIGAWSQVTLTQTAAPVAGSAATLEVMTAGAALGGGAALYQSQSLQACLSAAAATTGTLAATAAGSTLTLSLGGASFNPIPKAGDVVWIGPSSPMAGTTLKNVGAYVVSTASFNSMSLTSAWGLTTESVAAANLNGNTTPLKLQSGVATTTLGSRRINSASERQVQINASRTSDGAQFPPTAVGGRVGLEMSYNDGVSTDATVSISQGNVMTITFVGGSAPAPVSVNLLKYSSLGDLVDYLNTVSGLSARLSSNIMKSDSPTVLDMVTSVHIMSASSIPAYNARLKRDYSDFVALLAANFGLIAFQAGTLALKVGLPVSDATFGFLTGGTVGASANADVQAGLDAGLKVDVRMVLPLMSRDANKDIDDGLTDASSSYGIDSVHAAVQAHVATASSTLFKRERFGMLSFMGSFEDSKTKASAVAYERLQMAFQMARATASDGTLTWFQPWMLAATLTAGRAQANAGQPMLRKSFNITAVKQIGDLSIYSDTLVADFDPEDRGDLTEAITAGLLCWKAARGSGVRLESPDLTTRSRNGDPQGWVWERASVLFCCDEVRQALRDSLENLIGSSTISVTQADVKRTADQVLRGFVQRGNLIKYAINGVTSVGNGYNVQVDLYPPEAVEFIGVDVLAKRNAG